MEMTKVVKPFVRRGWPNTFGNIWPTTNSRHFNEICESCFLLIFSLVVFVYVCVNRDYNLLQGDFVIKIEPPSGWSFGKEWFHTSTCGLPIFFPIFKHFTIKKKRKNIFSFFTYIIIQRKLAVKCVLCIWPIQVHTHLEQWTLFTQEKLRHDHRM